jgi:hypothetical protein
MPNMNSSKRARYISSLTNRTSVLGIMGGTIQRGRYRNSIRSSINRATIHNRIPYNSIQGKQYMLSNNLLSKNPQCSGGIGRMHTLPGVCKQSNTINSNCAPHCCTREYFYELNSSQVITNPDKVFGNHWSNIYKTPYNIILVIYTSNQNDPNYSRSNNTLQIIELFSDYLENQWVSNSPEYPPQARPTLEIPFFNFYVLDLDNLTLDNIDWIPIAVKKEISIQLQASSGGYPLFIYFSPIQSGTNPGVRIGLLDSSETIYSDSYSDSLSLYTLPSTIDVNLDALNNLICLSFVNFFDNECSEEVCDYVVDQSCFNNCQTKALTYCKSPPLDIQSITQNTIDLWPDGTTDPNYMKTTLRRYNNLTTNNKPKNMLLICHLQGCGACNMILTSIRNILKFDNNVFNKYGIQPYEISIRCEADLLATAYAKSINIPLCVPVQRCPLSYNSAYYSQLANHESKTILDIPKLSGQAYESNRVFSVGGYPQGYYYDSNGDRHNLGFDGVAGIENCCFKTITASNQDESINIISTILCQTIKSANLPPVKYC